MTIRHIWKARVNWLLRPSHQAIRSSKGPLPQRTSDRTKTTSIRITQNTKESGMIFSAAKLNFLLIRQSGVPLDWAAVLLDIRIASFLSQHYSLSAVREETVENYFFFP